MANVEKRIPIRSAGYDICNWFWNYGTIIKSGFIKNLIKEWKN